ncbi:MAG TPA: HeH/LEM domain-containing protein [Pseudogracilibacillus sp.]|nr:HeH/LEM domain-containing protein [Pseudogracilibacillus sp.]
MEGLTVKEIKQKLDELGIEYNGKARKDELLKMLKEHTSTNVVKAEKPKQKSYVVVHRFKDLQDNNKIYRKGDKFNHVGKTKERITELSSRNNKIGEVLIKETD